MPRAAIHVRVGALRVRQPAPVRKRLTESTHNGCVSAVQRRVQNGKLIQVKKSFQQWEQKVELQLPQEIKGAEIWQEGQPGSANRDASHAIRQAQGEEPQAGDCDRFVEGAAKRGEGTEESKSLQVEESSVRRADGWSANGGTVC